jgi:hypothetical protein
MANIQALKKQLAQLKKRKAQALKELQPKKRRGRPPGSKNRKKASTTNNSAAPSRRRGKFSIEMRSCYKMPDGLSLVMRKTDKGYIRQWAVSEGTELLGYFTYYEDAVKAIKENKQ